MTQDHTPGDTQVQEAYDRLARSLAGSDLLDDVRGRIRRRRAARRAGLATAAVLVVGGVLGGVAVLGGGDDDVVAVDQPSAPEPPPLVLTRGDGSELAFRAGDLAVACTRASDGTDLLVATRADLLDDVLAQREPADEAVRRQPLFYAEVRVGDVRLPLTATLPEEGPGASDERPFVVFAAFPDGGERANEVSSAESGSRGTVTITEARCGAEPRLALEVDAVLGSEVGQPARRLVGALGL